MKIGWMTCVCFGGTGRRVKKSHEVRYRLPSYASY